MRKTFRLFKALASSAVCVLSVVSSPAVWATVSIPDAYLKAARQHDVPPDLLYAVALTESSKQLEHGVRPWPWTLNIAGKGHYFSSRKEACDALFRAQFETRLIDVGITQLNMRWQPQLFGAGNRFVDPCDALDPYANLEEAAGLLREHYDVSGDWLSAAGRYHRPAGGEPAARYRRAVAANLERIPEVMTAESSVSSVIPSLDEQPSTRKTAKTVAAQEIIERDDALVWVGLDDSASNLVWVTPSLPENPESWIEPEVDWYQLVAVID